MPASTEITLTLQLRLGVRRPAYRTPWKDPHPCLSSPQ